MACSRFLRVWLLLENLALFAGGILLLVIGTDALISGESRVAVIIGTTLVRGTAMLLVATGCLVLLLSLAGCCGATLRSPCLVGLFSCCSVLLLVIAMAGAVSAMLITGPASDAVELSMIDSMKRYDNDSTVTGVWDFLQRDFHCCGVHDGSDWAKNGSLTNGTLVPLSCCRHFPENGTYWDCQQAPTNRNSYFSTGCLSSVQSMLIRHGWEFGGATIGVAVFLMLSVVLSCCYIRHERRNDYQRLTV